MDMKRWVGLAACLAMVFGIVIPAAPGQDRPGQPTRGQVWIENRGRTEAIPVTVQEPVAAVVRGVAAMPLPVQLAGSVPGTPPPAVAARAALQPWEYQTISVPIDADPRDLTKALTTPGLAGWEAVGVQIVSGPNVFVVMKRPLQDARPGAR